MPGLAILLSKKKPPMDEPDLSDKDDGEEHSEDDTKHAVMSAFIKSVKLGDVEGALQAFHDLKDLCSGDVED